MRKAGGNPSETCLDDRISQADVIYVLRGVLQDPQGRKRANPPDPPSFFRFRPLFAEKILDSLEKPPEGFLLGEGVDMLPLPVEGPPSLAPA